MHGHLQHGIEDHRILCSLGSPLIYIQLKCSIELRSWFNEVYRTHSNMSVCFCSDKVETLSVLLVTQALVTSWL